MRGDRPADLKYLIQLAQAAEINGFEAVLTPTGLWCEDAWLTTAMLIGSTESLKYLVAFRPGLISPTLAAQMATTFQWQSQGRLMLNVVTGGESIEQRAFGDFLEKRARYARCGEFLDIVRRLWTSDSPVTGMREKPERSARVMAWRTVLKRSMAIRSVRPTAPYSMDPPVNTATGSCPSWLSTKDRWPGVCPGVCMTVTVSDPDVRWSWSRTARRWKLTSSDAATT